MSINRDDECRQEVMSDVQDDWTHISIVAAAIRNVCGRLTRGQEIDKVSQILDGMMRDGLIQVGSVYTKDGKFKKWELARTAVLDRVKAEGWILNGEDVRYPPLQADVWVSGTSQKDGVG